MNSLFRFEYHISNFDDKNITHEIILYYIIHVKKLCIIRVVQGQFRNALSFY